MSVVAFDTLKFVQTLRDKAKLTPEQAECIALACAEVAGERLVTTEYLDAGLESLKTDILRWMFVSQLALGGFMFAAVKLIH